MYRISKKLKLAMYEAIIFLLIILYPLSIYREEANYFM